MKTRVQQDLGARLGPGERMIDIVPAWVAQAPPGLATLFSRRRIHAVAVTTDRLAIYEVGPRGGLEPVVDRAFDKLVKRAQRFARPLARVAIEDASTPWFIEFKPRHRQLARTLANSLDGHTADTTESPSDQTPTADGPSPTTRGGPPRPPLPPPLPTPDAILAVLAMGEPDAVALLAQVSERGFPPPPDPLPIVDRRSVRSVARHLRQGTATGASVQRWAAVVQRAAAMNPPPIAYDHDDPFPDQMHRAIGYMLTLDPSIDPGRAADEIDDLLDGRSR